MCSYFPKASLADVLRMHTRKADTETGTSRKDAVPRVWKGDPWGAGQSDDSKKSYRKSSFENKKQKFYLTNVKFGKPTCLQVGIWPGKLNIGTDSLA